MQGRTFLVFALLILFWPVVGLSQTLSPHRSIAFSQVAVGLGVEGNYETLINITNRGTATFNGTLNLFQGTNQPWSPGVASTPSTAITSNSIGVWSVTIASGQTVTLDITSAGSVASGFAVITPIGDSLSGLVEGTLTYYVKSGTGAVLNSVGVAPSSEMYVTTIPFDDFNTIALALANLNPFPITVHLKLYSDTGQEMAMFDQQLQNMQQVPKYLRDFFTGVNMTRGRLEIQSDNLFIGTALTQVAGGQYSSLPFLPAAKTYTFQLTGGHDATGEVYVWVDETGVQGYARNLTENGTPVNGTPIFYTGRFSNNGLVIFSKVEGENLIEYMSFSSFAISTKNLTGTWIDFFTDSGTLNAQGTVTLTATN